MKKDIIFSANQVNGRVRGRKNFILTDVSFVLPGGYIMGLIGKNGAVSVRIFNNRNGHGMECIIRSWNFICCAACQQLVSAPDQPLESTRIFYLIRVMLPWY